MDHCSMLACKLSLQALHWNCGKVCFAYYNRLTDTSHSTTDFSDSVTHLNSINPIRMFHMALGGVVLEMKVSSNIVSTSNVCLVELKLLNYSVGMASLKPLEYLLLLLKLFLHG